MRLLKYKGVLTMAKKTQIEKELLVIKERMRALEWENACARQQLQHMEEELWRARFDADCKEYLERERGKLSNEWYFGNNNGYGASRR